jgi:hypothetical protein
VAGQAATIDTVTTTPDDEDWLRLADEAFSPPEDETSQDSDQPRWRYRSPVM